ncbi:MAG: putative PEP-binding protein [Paracoccaceae bacterium]
MPQTVASLKPLSIHATGAVDAQVFGARGARLARLAALGLDVPQAVVYPPKLVDSIADGAEITWPEALAGQVLALRAAPQEAEWGGPESLLPIGVAADTLDHFIATRGEGEALRLQLQCIRKLGAALSGATFNTIAPAPEITASPAVLRSQISAARAAYLAETDDAFPATATGQLRAALRHMARGWHSASARILRMAKGAPEDAGLAIIAQSMVPDCRTGRLQFVDETSGQPRLVGYLSVGGAQQPLTDLNRETLAALRALEAPLTRGHADACRVKFALDATGKPWLTDVSAAHRSARATLRIAVDLAKAGWISQEDALLRIEPRSLVEHLHHQIDPHETRDVVTTALPASPGAATGRIVLTAQAAMAAEAQGEAAILVRHETSPEDIRGMHSSVGVLTIRGGMTSHAAVIARGLGLPCVVGAADLRLDMKARSFRGPKGRTFSEGDIITIDGTRGEVINGTCKMIAPDLGGPFTVLMSWADKVRSIGVRANADTPTDARAARGFNVDGIGLCRTEHMFFEPERIIVMREMILADGAEARAEVLERLLPMQRADFIDLFDIMRGLPVTIRLLDPPLHEFLPNEPDEVEDLARAMNISGDDVRERAAELAEVNPMLGMRGVRLGITMPEIYDMQARAIFQAAVSVNAQGGAPVVPEIMIPLVSANREVELVKERIVAIAKAVREETGSDFAYKLGVMVETPRAALRANDLAKSAAFLSFGTNDLTQMTYGLSRDDAGRFMRDYVQRGVFPEDPFHTLDLEGVGELLVMAARRGRDANPDLVLGLCGEHGGDPAAVRFCRLAGFDYVSCSPFRVPIARLAAAQASILAERGAALK